MSSFHGPFPPTWPSPPPMAERGGKPGILYLTRFAEEIRSEMKETCQILILETKTVLKWGAMCVII